VPATFFGNCAQHTFIVNKGETVNSFNFSQRVLKMQLLTDDESKLGFFGVGNFCIWDLNTGNFLGIFLQLLFYLSSTYG
jgi:hypothetical protein